MIRSPLQNQLRQQVSRLQGDDFQQFVIQLMFFHYGTDGFTTLRPQKDEGADGIIKSKRAVIACWGPDLKAPSQLKKAFEKKVKSDFDSYQKNWLSTYPNWIVVINHEPAPNEVKFVDSLKSGSPIMGLNEILHLINQEIGLANRRVIYELLQIPKEFVSQDVLDGLLEDILKSAESDAVVEYNSPLYVPDKIRLNFDQHDIDSVEDEFYQLEEEYFSAIKSALSAFEDRELTRIKRKMIQDYHLTIGNSFSEKFNNLTMQYLNKYAFDGDSEFRDVIRGLLFWIFEQCLIGRKTPAESQSEVQS